MLSILKKHILLKTTFSTFIIVSVLFTLLFSIYQFGIPGSKYTGTIRSRNEAGLTALTHLATVEKHRIDWWFKEVLHDMDALLHAVFASHPDISEHPASPLLHEETITDISNHLQVYFKTHPFYKCLYLFDSTSSFIRTPETTSPICTSSIIPDRDLSFPFIRTYPLEGRENVWVLRKNRIAAHNIRIGMVLLVETTEAFKELTEINNKHDANSFICIVSEKGVFPSDITSRIRLPSYDDLRTHHRMSAEPFMYNDTSAIPKRWRISLEPLTIRTSSPLYIATISDITAYNRTTQRSLLLSFLAVVTGALLASIILGINLRIQTRHLLTLKATVEEIEKGNKDARVSIPTPDEIGTLASAFNRMLDNYSSLQCSLEDKITHRTVSLRKNNLLLEEQLNFEQLLSSISKKFLLSEPHSAAQTVSSTITCICDHFTLDFCFLYTRTTDSQFELREKSIRNSLPVPQFPQITALFNNITTTLLSGETVVCNSLDDSLFNRYPDERDFFRKVGIHSFIAVPLLVRDTINGALICGNTSPTTWSPLTPGKLGLCGAFTIGALLRYQFEQDLLKSRDRLQTLTLEAGKVEEKQRDMIAGWIHDSIGQELALIKMQLGIVNAGITDPETEKDLKHLRSTIDHLLTECREKVFDLSPPLLREFGLPQTLSWFCQDISAKNQIKGFLSVEEQLPKLPYDLSQLLFRCVRELVINLLKHAHAEQFEIRCYSADCVLHLLVSDDGIGIPDIIRYGYGLLSIQERINDLGGTFAVQRKMPCGTEALISIPLSTVTAHIIHSSHTTKASSAL